MNPRTEERLRAALAAKAASVSAQMLSPGSAPTEFESAGPGRRTPNSDPRRFVRVIGPLAAAAAIVAVIAGGSAIIWSATSDPAQPGHPAPPAASSASLSPSPDTGPTALPSSQPNAGTTTATQPYQAPPPTGTGPHPQRFGYDGVSLTLPSTWTQTAAPARFAEGGICISPTNGGCALYVHQGPRLDGGGAVIDYSIAGSCSPTLPSTYARRAIDGQVVEYRTFAAGCGEPASEQWFVPTDPQVEFWHALGSLDATVGQAVANAVLPAPAGPLPERDRAAIVSITAQSDGYHVTMQRIVHLDSGAIPEPGAVYSFVIATHANLGVPLTCSEWKIPGYQPYQACQLSNLVTQSAKGPHPSDGTLPINAVPMVIWTDGRTVTTFVTADTFPGGV